jgi:diguanylate cyclase (GGDEF)-like protein
MGIIGRFRLGIRTWLLLHVFFSAVPIALFSAFTIYQLGVSEEAALTASLQQRTEAAAQAVEQRLASATIYLTALAESQPARRGDLLQLYHHAYRLIPLNPDITSIVLIGLDGEAVFNTLRPFGAKLPPVGAPEAARKVFDLQRPVVSGPFVGKVSGELVTSLGVPVMIDGKVAYTLRMVIPISIFTVLLGEQHLSPEWTASIIDADGTYVARTRSPEMAVGTTAPSGLIQAMKVGQSGVFDTNLKEGDPVKAALVRLPSWEWTVAIGVPTEVLNKTMWRSLLVIGSGFAVLLVVGLGGALALSRHLVWQVRLVAEASAALSRGEHPVLEPTRVAELDELGAALGLAKQREVDANTALADAVVAHQQVAAELSAARYDFLTGLPGRALLLEMAESMRRQVAVLHGRQLALLFVDLDGFKEVNDRFGHDRGDKVLQETANILRDTVREGDVAGRLGGDEFVLCLALAGDGAGTIVTAVAARVVERVGRIGDGIGCSIGIAIWPDDCASVSCALSRADEAMYEAKRLGKNRFAIYGEPRPGSSVWKTIRAHGCMCIGGKIVVSAAD